MSKFDEFECTRCSGSAGEKYTFNYKDKKGIGQVVVCPKCNLDSGVIVNGSCKK